MTRSRKDDRIASPKQTPSESKIEALLRDAMRYPGVADIFEICKTAQEAQESYAVIAGSNEEASPTVTWSDTTRGRLCSY